MDNFFENCKSSDFFMLKDESFDSENILYVYGLFNSIKYQNNMLMMFSHSSCKYRFNLLNLTDTIFLKFIYFQKNSEKCFQMRNFLLFLIWNKGLKC